MTHSHYYMERSHSAEAFASAHNPEKASTPETKRRRLTIEHSVNKILETYGPMIDPETKRTGKRILEGNAKLLTKKHADLTTAEKVAALWDALVSYTFEAQEKSEEQPRTTTTKDGKPVTGHKQTNKKGMISPYVIQEIQTLWKDDKVRTMFLEAHAGFIETQKTFNASDLKKKNKEIAELKTLTDTLRKQLIMEELSSTQRKETLDRLQLANIGLEEVQAERQKILHLEGIDPTKEHTDAIATERFERMQRYAKEAKKGFVWTESLEKKMDDVVEGMTNNGLSPLFIGPPGTGKTAFLKALARKLTGQDVEQIPISKDSGDNLEKRRDLKSDGASWDLKETIAGAFTGYANTADSGPVRKTGQIVNLDELFLGVAEKIQALVKRARNVKVGKKFSDAIPFPVLPGSFLTATSNAPLTSEALAREYAKVAFGYIPNTKDQPELYEFMLAILMKDKSALSRFDEADFKPKWQRVEVPKDQQTEKLSDGRVVTAKEEFVEDASDKEHGYMWRLSNAVRAIQDAYIHGSKYNEKQLAQGKFFYEADQNGNKEIKGFIPDLEHPDPAQSVIGLPLTLSEGTSTITLENVSSWVDSFVKSGKKDIVPWMQKMLQDHMKKTDGAEAEKIRLICDYFHLFDPREKRKVPEKPMSLLDIGYLSPAVPRPVEAKAVVVIEGVDKEKDQKGEFKEYETLHCILEDGITGVEVRVQDVKLTKGDRFSVYNVDVPLRIYQTTESSTDYTFQGIVDDPSQPTYHNQPIGKLGSGDLYRILTPDNLERGQFNYKAEELIREVKEDVKEQMKEYWKSECVNNSENNPDNVPAPEWS